MGKYNTTKVGVIPSVVNEMGEKAYMMEAKEDLVATVLTTFLSDSYYEKESEIISRIKDALSKVDPLFVAKLALYARNEANMRSVTHLLAGELAKRISGSDWAKRFYSKIVVRPDDMTEILAYYAHINGNKLNKIPNSIKKGFKKALERLDAYQIDKYKMKNKDISMIDLVRLFHPCPTKKNEEAYRRLINGESLDDLYSAKTIEKTMSKAGSMAKNDDEKAELKNNAIQDVLNTDKGMSMLSLLRNLRNIILISPDSVDEACRQLTIKEKVLNSRILPFRFASAYEEIEKLTYTKPHIKTSIAFESDIKQNIVSEEVFNKLKTKVLDSIETALQYSVNNIPSLSGNTAILIDHSGSVRGDMGGHSRVSAFSKTTTAMIGNLFGSMMAYRQKNVYIGLFGDKLINVPINRNKKMLDFNSLSFNLGASCGGSTEDGLYQFLYTAIKENKKVDNLIIFSDMVIGSNGTGGWDKTSWAPRKFGTFQNLFKDFKKINPQCNTICVNIKATGGKSVFHKSLNVLTIAGWNDKIFDTIASNTTGWDEIIKKIEKIEI